MKKYSPIKIIRGAIERTEGLPLDDTYDEAYKLAIYHNYSADQADEIADTAYLERVMLIGSE